MLYGVSSNNGATAQLWRVKPGASEREQIATAPDPFNIRASPDGRWIMYTSLVSGRSEVFVQGYPSGPQRQITSDGHWIDGSAARTSTENSQRRMVDEVPGLAALRT